MTQHTYDNGVTRESQLAYNKRYRDRQKKKRIWFDRFADTLGVPLEEVVKLDPDDLATAYRHFMNRP